MATYLTYYHRNLVEQFSLTIDIVADILMLRKDNRNNLMTSEVAFYIWCEEAPWFFVSPQRYGNSLEQAQPLPHIDRMTPFHPKRAFSRGYQFSSVTRPRASA
jgi:hypothetical protein